MIYQWPVFPRICFKYVSLQDNHGHPLPSDNWGQDVDRKGRSAGEPQCGVRMRMAGFLNELPWVALALSRALLALHNLFLLSSFKFFLNTNARNNIQHLPGTWCQIVSILAPRLTTIDTILQMSEKEIEQQNQVIQEALSLVGFSRYAGVIKL